MKEQIRSVEFAPGKTMHFDIGRIAKQADGACVVRLGDTMVLCTVVSAKEPKEGQNFFPLTVDHRESFSAAGRFPGGFLKREGRPSEKEILSSRLIDRTMRPLFPKGYLNDTQVITNVISSDGQNDGDVLAGVGASMAATISAIPFAGPMAEVRVGFVDSKFIINPTVDELKESAIDMVVGGTLDSVVMIEGEMSEISESTMLMAIKFAHEAIKKLCQFQLDVRAEIGLEKRPFTKYEVSDAIKTAVNNAIGTKLDEVVAKGLNKEDFSAQVSEVKTAIKEKFEAEFAEDEDASSKMSDVNSVFEDALKSAMRNRVLNEKIRLDGRQPAEIRDIWSQTGYIVRAHGSSLFTRGETQALVSCTLGTKRDEQSIDGLFSTEGKQFMLHYNFPPYSVGETGRTGNPGRREIGHGHLAERALKKMMPTFEEFGYVIRLISDITESNGSSSMASVCGGSMALMDAGVPIKKPVGGIAMGMIVGENNAVVLSDIRGEEDHMGDMDFKICGTRDGITAVQMDIKVQGIPYEVMEEALNQAKDGRFHMLDKMAETITEPRQQLSEFAPQIIKVIIDGDTIGAVIGPGGKVIQSLQKETGTEIWIEEVGNKGEVTISADSLAKAQDAEQRIKMITGQLEEGAVYKGVVKAIKDFGAFVEIAPGRDGLLHISEYQHERVNNLADFISVGDELEVMLLKVEQGGKLRLSRKQMLPKP
jgi:polyribonucleotide nucleotidyltransferase